ncbi:uracil-DNA glycosylase-like protein [Mycena amicta]|nr:uracil-DNA glycosylase-like protein [Mycena amicta]
MATDTTVYLEDLATNYTRPKKRPAVDSNDGSTTVKRQRTLFESFAPDTRPKATCSAILPHRKGQKLNSIPFSLAAFKDALPNDETRALLALECDVFGKSWFKVLADEFPKPYFLALKRFLYKEGVHGSMDPAPPSIFPPPKNIYTWSDTPLGRVKVNQAHGLSFSVPPGMPIPASLHNAYSFLNAVLTVEAGKSDSHANRGWEQFTERVMQIVDAYGGANLPSAPGEPAPGVGRGVVIMAWGSKAQQRVKGLNASKHLILQSAHPSPRSADRGFFGNGHFCKANEWLETRYGPGAGIDWCGL